MIWLLPTPSPVSKLDRRHTDKLGKRDNLPAVEGAGGGGGGARSYDGEKASSFINHSILSDLENIRDLYRLQ
jgi:hypothetical protein